MLSPDDYTRTEETRQPVRYRLSNRTSSAERRHSILVQKQQERQQDRTTDILPNVNTESLEVPNAKLLSRQITVLREENKHLESELERIREELRQLDVTYRAVRADYEKELAVVHNGQQQEIEQYSTQLQEVVGERNHLKESYFQLERRFQELYSDFQSAVEDEAQKVIAEAAQTLILAPDKAPVLMKDVMKTIELHAQQVEDRQLVEVLYLKREVQRLGDLLTGERQELERERIQLLHMQQTAHEQAELRHKVVLSRLRTRWTFAVVSVATASLLILVLLQMAFLKIDQVPFTAPLDFAIFAPILLGVIFSIAVAHPLSAIRSIYRSAPHKKAAK